MKGAKIQSALHPSSSWLTNVIVSSEMRITRAEWSRTWSLWWWESMKLVKREKLKEIRDERLAWQWMTPEGRWLHINLLFPWLNLDWFDNLWTKSACQCECECDRANECDSDTSQGTACMISWVWPLLLFRRRILPLPTNETKKQQLFIIYQHR